jgi:hypothetical protein
MDEGPNPDENEKPGARLDRISPSGWKKRHSLGGLVGESGLTHSPALSFCNLQPSRSNSFN